MKGRFSEAIVEEREIFYDVEELKKKRKFSKKHDTEKKRWKGDGDQVYKAGDHAKHSQRVDPQGP